jgi:hypothetical protein
MENSECIDPELRKPVASLEWNSLAENVSALSEHPSARMRVRLHWLSCPLCRQDYSYALDVLALVDRVILDRVAATLVHWCEKWATARQGLEVEIAPSETVFAEKIAELAMFGVEVQNALSFVVEEPSNFTTELKIENETSERISLSKSSEFILSLAWEVQGFVFEAVRCQEMVLFPIQGDFGPARMFVPIDEVEASEFQAEQSAAEEDKVSFGHILTQHLLSEYGDISMGSAYEGIRIHARIHLDRFLEQYEHNREQRAGALKEGTANLFARQFEHVRKEQADGFDSLKAGQMEIIRLAEQNGRSALSFEPAIEAQIGPLYRRLNDATKRQLQIAEYIYSINRSEPDFSHGSVMNIALAYENEVLRRLIWPFLESMRANGTQYYDGGSQDSKRVLMKSGVLNVRNVGLATFRWCLQNDPQLNDWVRREKSIHAQNVIADLSWIIKRRDAAAHELICRLSTADEVRNWALIQDGPFARLHPA